MMGSVCLFDALVTHTHTRAHTTVVCCKDGVGPMGQLRTDYLHNSGVL